MAGQQAGNDKASAGRFRWPAILLPVALLAVGLVFALADDAPSAEAHEVEATQTTTECVDLVYGYPSTRICWPLTKTYPVPHSHPTPKPTPQPTPKPCTSLFCGMTQAEICAAAGLRVHPSGTGCGPTPTPTPQPTCEHGIDPGTGNCATAIPLPTPTPQPTCEHGIDPGTG
ncbi:MAG: hypothetical protein OXT07_14815, partial [bacterium]|nr:hypothetical protein [bacterium]